MVSFDDENVDFNKKQQEHRNLAEFLGKSLEEVRSLEQTSPEEYSEILNSYRQWCLKKFNEDCFKFNESARRKMPNANLSNNSGLTA